MTPFELTKKGIKRHQKKVRRARLLAFRLRHPQTARILKSEPVGRDITNEVVKIVRTKTSLLKRFWIAFKTLIKFGFKPYAKKT
ncbi:MAG: hypothetical protein WC619_01910 [Patescibacteria group bacterium]